jgi:molybdenum cofactor sulfurtransferase
MRSERPSIRCLKVGPEYHGPCAVCSQNSTGAVYLDHAGTTLYPKSLVETFAASMISGLYGNPHSRSPSSVLSTKRVDDVRLRALRFVKADPDEFDLVFVANATAGIKLVVEGFRAARQGFSYRYHQDSHTSLVGARESAITSQCLESDEAVEQWLAARDGDEDGERPTVFAYPAQSNMNGRRLPLSWCSQVRQRKRDSYTLLDAAALVSTSQLDLSCPEEAPDYTVLSFYKIFGFPDLGALILRKSSGHILTRREYFGGGTVEMVSCMREQWHLPKDQSFHEQLEDGTLPIHSILALDNALDVHQRLYGSMDQISKHTSLLASDLFRGLSSLRHHNGRRVCKFYTGSGSSYLDPQVQGPVIAFNIQNSDGTWVANTEIEKLASIKNIHLRTGGVCNPGGVAHHLELEPWEMAKNFSAGQRCGNDIEEAGGKPTGIMRVSLGAMSNRKDVAMCIDFIHEFYTEQARISASETTISTSLSSHNSEMYIESLTVYPIKSCGGWSVPANIPWEVKDEGLAWDREWCLVHAGTCRALSQKQYPRMTLLRPEIDLEAGVMQVTLHDSTEKNPWQISIPLFSGPEDVKPRLSNVCNESVDAYVYTSRHVTAFFTAALEVPCCLARFPPGGSGPSKRHAKAHLQQHQLVQNESIEQNNISTSLPSQTPRPILLSNESPILVITRSSLNHLNSLIALKGGKPAHPSVFRSNIIIGSSSPTATAYSEDKWIQLQIGHTGYFFNMLGSCRRCSMVCVDQDTAERNEEPFVTLAKTRRFGNKVFFGEHMCRAPQTLGPGPVDKVYIRVGDPVKAHSRDL